MWSTGTSAPSSGPGRARAAAAARHREQLPDVGGRDRPARRDAHRHRARPAGPRQLRQAAGRLLDRRLRQRDARPAVGAGRRAGDGRRPLPRRRHRAAVRLPVPRALPAARAGRQRRAGPGALRRAARGHPARRRTGAHRPGERVRPAAARPAGHGTGRPDGGLAPGAATSPRPATRCSRSRTSRRGGRSCAPCAGSWTPAARRSPRSTGSTWPTPSRCWSSGAAATRSCRRSTPRRCARWCPAPASRCSRTPGTGRTSTSPTASATCCWTSSASTEPAAHDLDSWRRLLAQNWDGVARPVGH